MSVENGVSAAASIGDAVKTVVESKTTAAAVAGSTLGLGVSGFQSTISIVATCCGIVLSLVLIGRNLIGTWQDWKTHQKSLQEVE